MARIVSTPEAVEFVAETMFNRSDRNRHDAAGFCSYAELPDNRKEVWRHRALLYVSEIISRLKVEVA